MKILIISDAWKPQINGVVRTYEPLVAELRQRGHEVKIIGPRDFPVRMPLPAYPEIKLAVAPYRKLKRMIRGFAPECLHIATEGPLGLAARRYCLNTGLAFTTWYHTQFPEYIAQRVKKIAPVLENRSRARTLKMVQKFHASARTMIVTSQNLENDLRGQGFKVSMHRVTRGTDVTLFKPGPATLFQDLPGPVALYVGRVAMEKNLGAFLSMDWDGTKVIVGDGPSQRVLKRKYPQAYFVGKKTGDDLAAHYRSADVFVFPSRTDTFGLVLIEAMASGLPIAAYDVTGPKDIVTKPFLGCLDENLAYAAREALQHGTSKKRHDYAQRHYSWMKATDQFLAALTVGIR